MTHFARTARKLLTGLLLACLAAGAAIAQQYPDHPIRLLVGTGPGASSDFITRLMAEGMSKALGQPVVVENRPGASGIIAFRTVMAAKPDGYTLLAYFSDALLIAPLLAKTPPYDPAKDLIYIGQGARSNGWMLAVNPAVPANTFAELVQLAKSSPKRISYSTYGRGSSPHLSFELMSAQAGIEMIHAPYKSGAEMYNAVVSGTVDLVGGFVGELVKAGKLRALAVGGSQRSAAFPDIPTLVELGYGDQMFAPVSYGIAAPLGTPKDVVDKLTAALRTAMQTPGFAERLAPQNMYPQFAPGDEVVSQIQKGVALNTPLIRKLGLNDQ